MPLTVGDTVGPYRIVEQLGQGGMATVFRAYHAALDRDVAIKVLHPAFTADSSFLARFQREARVVARLEHPNIVPIYDYAEHEGAPYLVMKFIPGDTLKARLAKSVLSASEILRVVEAVGAALQFAHGQGVLHRDIKPSNIMLASDGAIYLTDFGLARMAGAGESTLSFDTLLGTPSYMSPEQARGDKALDAGTDIYSFGVVIYELIVGRVPFSADTPYAVIHDHIFTPLPSPRSLNPDVPASVEPILTKALAKDRADRYPTVGEMVADLRRALEPTLAEAPAKTDLSRAFASELTIAAATPAPAPPPAEVVPPTAAAVVAPSGPALVELAPAKEATQPSAAPATSSPHRLHWWQLALLGVVLLGGCATLTLGALARAKRLSTGATQTAVAAVAATGVAAHPATTVAAGTSSSTSIVTTPAATAGTPDPARAYLAAAERDFVAGQTTAGLAQLDLAVGVNPADTQVLLRAGDLALSQKLAVEALRRYYGPGNKLESAAPDPHAAGLQSHGALAFYVAAADQSAGTFLDAAATTQPLPPCRL